MKPIDFREKLMWDFLRDRGGGEERSTLSNLGDCL